MINLNIESLQIHEYANLTPNMVDEQFKALVIDIQTNGQLEPVKVCKGKIYDGRHRLKALKLLNKKKIKAIVDDNLTEEDIRSQVRSLENRRHQTPTQLAIMAYKEYVMLSKNDDTKESQGKIAERFGITRTNLAEVKSLAERAPDVVEMLYDGHKFNIGTVLNPTYTNNVRTINAYIREDRQNRLSTPAEYGFKFTTEETEFIDQLVKDLIDTHGTSVALEVSKRIYGKYSDQKNI